MQATTALTLTNESSKLPNISHNSKAVVIPAHNMTNRPTHLQLNAQDRDTPVAIIQNHHEELYELQKTKLHVISFG